MTWEGMLEEERDKGADEATRRIVLNLLKKGKPVEEIAEDCLVAVEYVRALMNP